MGIIIMTGSLSTDPLFKGLTRPPLMLGVSYPYAVFNFMITMIAFIYAPPGGYKFLALSGLFIIHAIGYYFCSREPLFMEIFQLKMQKCSMARKNKHFHGANSYDVLI